MAKASCSNHMILVVVVILAILNVVECSSRGASAEFLNRKFFVGKKLEMSMNKKGFAIDGKNEMLEDWQLRWVPGGPDPLHHNGQGPKKKPQSHNGQEQKKPQTP